MTSMDTLVRDVFPEDNQRHLLIYEDRTLQSMGDGMRRLYRISNPLLRYHQRLPINNLTMDRSYEGLIRHNEEMGVLTIRFPSESAGIGNIQNNRNCKMSIYYRDTQTGYVREVSITSRMILDASRNIELIVYTNYHPDLVVSFDVYLMKPKAAL
jgi:hypothetical protein